MKRSLGVAWNVLMMLFGLALLAGLTSGALTSETLAFRGLSAALALVLALLLAKIVFGWWSEHRSHSKAE